MIRLLPLGFVICLTACASDPQIVVRPEIPAELLKPEPAPKCQIVSLKDTGICIVDFNQTLGRANGKIVAINEIING